MLYSNEPLTRTNGGAESPYPTCRPPETATTKREPRSPRETDLQLKLLRTQQALHRARDE